MPWVLGPKRWARTWGTEREPGAPRLLHRRMNFEAGGWVEEHSGWLLAVFFFAICCCPLRFDFDDSDFSQSVVAETATLHSAGSGALLADGARSGLGALTVHSTWNEENSVTRLWQLAGGRGPSTSQGLHFVKSMLRSGGQVFRDRRRAGLS